MWNPRTILPLLALIVAGQAQAQGESLRALTMRPMPETLHGTSKAEGNTYFLFQNLPQNIPLMDDFSIDRTRKRIAQADDPGVTLDATIYKLEVGGVSTPGMAFATDTTRRYIVDLEDPDNPVLTNEPLPPVDVTVFNLAVYPPTSNVVEGWPPYNIFDTIQSPPEDTLFLASPDLVQDSLLVYAVPPNDGVYIMNGVSTPLILWEDDDVFVNANYPVAPPTIGVATFDGLSRTGLPYNFEQFSSHGIADHLTSVPINLLRPASDSIYASFFYQARGLSGDGQPQVIDSLVLEFYAPQEDFWYRVWRTPYPSTAAVQPFQQVMIPIKEFRYLQNGFRMRFLNYATLSGSFDHWHLDYVRLGAQRSFDDTTLVDVAYITPEVSLLQTYTSMPFNKFSQAPAAYMAPEVTELQRNLDDEDRFITWRMRQGIDGTPLPAPGPIIGSNIASNASTVFESVHPISEPYDPALSTDAAFWRVQFITNATPDINRYNDTLTFVQELSNYYAYDDGSAEMGYGLNSNNAKLAYRFDLAGGDSLRAIRMYFNPMANEPPLTPPFQGSFLITIWSSLSPEVIQHQNFSFSSPEYRDHGLNMFVEYPLDSTIYVEGSIFIGWTQTNNANMNLGFDRNRNNGNKIFYKTGSSWASTAFEGSLMMRPVFVAAVDPWAGVPPDLNTNVAELALVPNPSGDHFVLRTPNGIPPGARVQCLDALGRNVREATYMAGDAVPVSDLADGLYLVRLLDRSGAALGTGRLLIQH